MLLVDKLSLAINGTKILKEVSLSVEPGRVLGIVGESGSGKSLTALSIMQLLPDGAETSGSVQFQGREILDADDALMQDLRGDDIGMIFQEPMTALNPVHTIGDQVAEGIILHAGASPETARERVARLLERVGLPPNQYPLSRYPHELSGGQRQRVMIAIAIAQNPSLLIADEPTTALDVTLQAQVLKLLRSLIDDSGTGLILISHDLAVVAQATDDVIVMRNGEVMEAGPTTSVLRALKHPYTAQLAAASTHIPKRSQQPVLSGDQKAQEAVPLLEVRNLVRDYPGQRTALFEKPADFRAVNDVSFDLYAGQSMGLVGESGCGKSTLARMVLALDRPTQGKIIFKEAELTNANDDALRDVRRHMQIVFQDPFGSFNPRHRVERLVAEPLYLEPGLSNSQKRERVRIALSEVGLDSDALNKYPHEFSGGQRQRLAIARALITRPALIVADEPVSALDVSIRAQVLDLLADLQERLGLTYLFISHDLGVVRAICDEVLVMESGEIVERGPVSDVFSKPKSTMGQELLKATPDLERALANRQDGAEMHVSRAI